MCRDPSIIKILIAASTTDDQLINQYASELAKLNFKPASVKHRLEALDYVLQWLRYVLICYVYLLTSLRPAYCLI
jgi:hypothetical protein